MATNYGERVARVEEQQKATLGVVKEVKDDVKMLLTKFEDLDKRFVTRREVAVLKWVTGVLVAIVGLIIGQLYR